jgi:DNA polymerase-3 subunit delta
VEFQQLIKEMLGTSPKPLYVITTEEPFFLERIVESILENYLDKTSQEFNQTVIYGRDSSAEAICDAAREIPFFGDKKLIIVKEAQEIKDFKSFSAYAKRPQTSTLLCICFSKKLDGRLTWVKELKELDYLIEIKSLTDYQLPAFYKNTIKEFDLQLDDEAFMLLLEYIGNDLSTLFNELAKLKLNIPKGNRITKDIITRFIGISKEFNVFELQKALSAKDHQRIYWISKNMAPSIKSGTLPVIIGAMFSYFQKVWLARNYQSYSDEELSKLLKLPFKTFLVEFRQAITHYTIPKIEQSIQLLKEYDLKSKGMNQRNVPPGDLFTELVLQLTQL